MSSGPGDGSTAALTLARREARATLDAQLAALREIERKAAQLLQFTTALLGVVVSALALAGDVTAASNAYAAVGVAAVAAATLLAGITYTASTRVVGIDGAAVEAATDAESGEAYRRRVVAGYAEWIRFNEAANRRVAPLVTTTVLAVVAGALALGLAVLRAVTGPLPAAVPAVAFLGVAGAVYASGLLGQLRRLRRADPVRPPTGLPTAAAADDRGEPLGGQQCFVGGERDGDDAER
ncbi:hypothetical protein [Candidatus Halobonum tyrrellensis]|uniref:Uncharacterized protein n=1 Tax=Candidatus Halobonum tyrrellensis G22 TaxID=1324957 RepID=V4GWN7_9EURY|nr:hypothetical protein [Candidatus Halobonum tyrrellensis]ESP89586.1 hypothetical protein K933_03480 [Candidatus Halobonum tyrrellensis G22]